MSFADKDLADRFSKEEGLSSNWTAADSRWRAPDKEHIL